MTKFSPPANTALEWLEFGEKLLQSQPLFYGHGKDNAGDEAAALIVYALGISPTQSEESLKQPLNAVQQQKLQAVFNRRIKQRLPTPYITQEIYFADFAFYIDQRAIVPRSPMGEIIEQQFMPWLEAHNTANLSLLDLCCGSGCLGIASWLHCDFIADVVLSDVSKEALEVAKINAEKYQLSDKIELVQGDLFTPLKSRGQCFDIIICNPPYVDVKEMEALPAEYRHTSGWSFVFLCVISFDRHNALSRPLMYRTRVSNKGNHFVSTA